MVLWIFFYHKIVPVFRRNLLVRFPSRVSYSTAIQQLKTAATVHKYCMSTFCEIVYFFNYKTPCIFKTVFLENAKVDIQYLCITPSICTYCIDKWKPKYLNYICVLLLWEMFPNLDQNWTIVFIHILLETEHCRRVITTPWPIFCFDTGWYNFATNLYKL